MKHYGDITKINGADVEPVWIISGGSPCQDLSVAGKRAGLDGERSGLFMEQIRIIKEMRESDRARGRTDVSIRPRYMVWENVCGAFSSNKGEDFRIVLEETAKVADEAAVIPRLEGGQKWTLSGTILGDGWSISWRVHDAQFWGVPQRRKRIALVADFGGMSAPEILFERESVPRNTESSGETRQSAAADFETGINRTDTIGVDGYNQSITGRGRSYPMVSYGFDQGATRDVGRLFIEEKAKAITNGTCPGHHNGVVCFSQDRYDKYTQNGKSPTLTNSGGMYGGGSETLIAQLEHCVQEITKE